MPRKIQKLIAFGLLFSGLANFSVAAPNAEPPDATGTNLVALTGFNFRDRHYMCFVTVDELARSPQWRLDRPEPPLSPLAALRSAERKAFELVPDSRSFRPQKITLTMVSSLWYYIVQLEPSNPKSDTGQGNMEPIQIPVLMDGTVARFVEGKRVIAKQH